MGTANTSVIKQTIDAPLDAVVAVLADGTRHPEWGTTFFSGPAEQVGENDYRSTSPVMGGPITYRIEARRDLGVIDLYLAREGAPYGDPLPIRVVPNGDGADVLFVLSQAPQQSDEYFAQAVAGMGEELANLRDQLETPAVA